MPSKTSLAKSFKDQAANAAAAEAALKADHFLFFNANVRTIKQPTVHEPDVVATVTCDSVDADNEVVLPGGADLSRYIKAPRIMLCHAYGRPGDYYPLPIGKALWTKRQGNGIMQGIRFAKTAMAQEVAELFRDDMLNTFSIGFISKESSPPTKQEKLAYPEWAKVELIHRRWKLLEVSVAPIPSNEDALGRWVGKGRGVKTFKLWRPDRKGFLMPGESEGSAPERPALLEGTLVKINALAGGGWGRVKSLHLGVVPEVDEDTTDGSNEWAAKVAVLGEDGQETGHSLGALVKHVDALEDKSYHGYPWMGEEAEKSNAYRLMAHGLLDRHRKIMHSKRQGHLYAHEKDMTGHYVRHKSDDMEGKGYHTADQCKGLLESAPGCKGITVSYEHPPDEDSWEMLHPAPEGTNAWMVRSIKPDDESAETEEDDEQAEGEEKSAMVCPKCSGKAVEGDDGKMVCQKCGNTFAKALEETSGAAGGYLTPEEQGNKDDSLVEEEPPYMPKPREVVAWDRHEGMHAGAGRVKSLHKNGRIPGVYNSDVSADEKNVHAKIALFHKADDGAYEEPDEEGHHVAVHVKQLRPMPMLRSQVSREKAVVGYESGKAHDGSWDAAAARERIAKWASSDGSGAEDKIDWSKYAKAFTIIDGPKDLKGSFKLPHHDVVDGKLVVSKAGVKAALGALGGSRGGMKVSEEERAEAKSHLEKHEKDWGAGKESDDSEKSDGPKLTKLPPFQTLGEFQEEIRRGIKSERPSAELSDEILRQIIGCV